jgi:hypothetical protein
MLCVKFTPSVSELSLDPDTAQVRSASKLIRYNLQEFEHVYLKTTYKSLSTSTLQEFEHLHLSLALSVLKCAIFNGQRPLDLKHAASQVVFRSRQVLFFVINLQLPKK